MSTDEFLDQFAEALAVDRSAVSLDTSLSSLENWDSVAYLSVMVMLEESMGVALPPDKLVDAKTPGEILEAALSLR